MHVVALRPRPGDEAPERIDVLSAVSGLAQYETRSRVRVLGDWPGVLVSVAEVARAVEIGARLRKEGFDAWTMTGRPRASRLVARRLSVRGDCLHVEADGGQALEVPAATARMLLHVTDYRVDVDQILEHEAGPSNFGAAAARALLGLPNRASRARTVERRRERRERFARLWTVGTPPIEFRASALQYAALDDGPVAPTRTENFTRAMHRLRGALPRIAFDERLLSHAAQIRVLGPGLPPQQHLEAAIALLTRERTGSHDPYR